MYSQGCNKGCNQWCKPWCKGGCEPALFTPSPDRKGCNLPTRPPSITPLITPSQNAKAGPPNGLRFWVCARMSNVRARARMRVCVCER